MTASQSPKNTILALRPPRAPEATTPVIGAHYGVPLHVYDLKPMGLKIDVDPPQAGTVDAGDVITLVLNGVAVKNKSIEAGQENSVATLHIDKGLLLTGRTNELVYTITRGSENRGTSTPALTLLYNAVRPGMEDTTPGDRAHSELQLLLPQDVIEDGIDADRARQGVQVCFSYPYCRAHDRIRLNCNGQDVYRTVTVNEAPAIPSAEPTTVCVMVEEAVFERAGDSPRFVFSYTVTDQLGNGPDTDSPWSGTEIVDVHRKETRLVAPDLAEDPADPSDDPATIDLGKLGSKDLTVLVHAFAPRWQPNDRIRVTYTATPPGGAVVTHTVEETVSRIPFTYPVMVPNALVIADCVVRVKYELLRNGNVEATSRTATAVVIGMSAQVLLPSFLVRPAVNPIDVLAYPNGVTLRTEFLGALVGDRGRLVEVNAPAGTTPFPLVEFNKNKRMNTVLSPAFLAARHGRDIEFRWNLNRGGGQAGRSPVMSFRALTIKNEDPRLPHPDIAGVTGEILDINQLPTNSNIQLNRWAFQEAGQPLFLTLEGIHRAGETIELTLKNGQPHDSAEGLRITAPMDWLRELKTATTLKIKIGVNPGGTADINKAVIFPVRAYAIKTVSELALDTTPLNLNGTNISIVNTTIPWVRTGFDPANTAAQRSPSGGLAPYFYESSNVSIASVDNEGFVRSEGNGRATITVSDSAGQTKSFEVFTSNVINYLFNPSVHMSVANAWIGSAGGRIIPLGELQTVHLPILNQKFRMRPPALSDWYITRFIGIEAQLAKSDTITVNPLFRASIGTADYAVTRVICMKLG